ncbi:MAG: hypothetical protein VXX04_05080, partial [Actinomycetota bacterium]|nr:hypothetical protein [Actinomycetota bacterium]
SAQEFIDKIQPVFNEYTTVECSTGYLANKYDWAPYSRIDIDRCLYAELNNAGNFGYRCTSQGTFNPVPAHIQRWCICFGQEGVDDYSPRSPPSPPPAEPRAPPMPPCQITECTAHTSFHEAQLDCVRHGENLCRVSDTDLVAASAATGATVVVPTAGRRMQTALYNRVNDAASCAAAGYASLTTQAECQAAAAYFGTTFASSITATAAIAQYWSAETCLQYEYSGNPGGSGKFYYVTGQMSTRPGCDEWSDGGVRSNYCICGAALVQPEKPDYYRINSVESCEAAGLVSIESGDECQEAATALGALYGNTGTASSSNAQYWANEPCTQYNYLTSSSNGRFYYRTGSESLRPACNAWTGGGATGSRTDYCICKSAPGYVRVSNAANCVAAGLQSVASAAECETAAAELDYVWGSSFAASTANAAFYSVEPCFRYKLASSSNDGKTYYITEQYSLRPDCDDTNHRSYGC